MTEEQCVKEMQFHELPHYLTIKQKYDKNTDTISLYVESTIHVNKSVKMPTLWSNDFVKARPNEFREDILSWVKKRYNYTSE